MADEIEKTTKPLAAPAPAVAPAQVKDEFPNRAKYEDGFVFNFPISHYAARTEQEIRQALIDAPTEPEHIEPHMNLIREALKFHKVAFKQSAS